MFYALFITFVLNGNPPVEQRWKTYETFDECWEAATIIVRGRDNFTARCVLVESKE